MPTISHQGRVASEHHDKVDMLVGISFPPPVPYDGDEGQEGPPGSAFDAVNMERVPQAFRGTSSKSQGPDGVGPLAIRCLLNWDPSRIIALIRTHIRLGIHLDRWKLAKEVIIPKTGKNNFGAVGAYRCISLLNWLGKVVEKMAADLISEHCESFGGFHPGQYGCSERCEGD